VVADSRLHSVYYITLQLSRRKTTTGCRQQPNQSSPKTRKCHQGHLWPQLRQPTTVEVYPRQATINHFQLTNLPSGFNRRSNLNRFGTGQSQRAANLARWHKTPDQFCCCDATKQITDHTVNDCPLTRFPGVLQVYTSPAMMRSNGWACSTDDNQKKIRNAMEDNLRQPATDGIVIAMHSRWRPTSSSLESPMDFEHFKIPPPKKKDSGDYSRPDG